jgi:hypothetical protein
MVWKPIGNRQSQIQPWEEMTMKRMALFMLVALFGAALIFEPISAGQRHHRSTTISTDDEKELTDCSQIRMLINDAEQARSELVQTVPQSAVSTLRVEPPQNGGVHVQGWNSNEYSIKACLVASGATTADAKAILEGLKLSVRDGRVTVEGANKEDWVAYLIIRAPNGAVLDLSSKNGPISVSDFSGSIQSHSLNGPTTFRRVTGQVQSEAQNGPIGVTGSSGDFRLSAQNGPLTVDLDGSSWSGGEIEGHTQNGPLTLRLPEGYQSSIRVDASKHSPIECRAVQCQQAARTWDHPNLIQFGGAAPVIRLSTINGPVTITSRDGKR